jgi:hypothetical protein
MDLALNLRLINPPIASPELTGEAETLLSGLSRNRGSRRFHAAITPGVASSSLGLVFNFRLEFIL